VIYHAYQGDNSYSGTDYQKRKCQD